MNLKIRKMEKSDVEVLADINVRGWLFACSSFMDNDYLNSISVSEKAKKILQDFDKKNIMVVENERKILGYCQYTFESELADLCNADGEIEKLYVEPLMINQGIGTFLFNHIKEMFISENKRTFVLWCFEGAVQAKNFYQKMGGKILKKEYRKVGNKSYSDLCFIFNF